ncbi:MAG TPA: ATP-binding protein [Anaerolineae bacterium]|nr:ATP-binding protein [Anaerolineae bacterium]
MKRLKTLRVRFALWTAGLLFAALALFGLFVYANMSRSLVTAVDETLRLVVIQLVAEVDLRGGELVLSENPIEDPEYAQLREQGFSMRILNLDGQALQAYGPYRDLPYPPADFTVSEQPGEFTTITDPDSQDPVRVYTSPLVVDDQVVGKLQVAQNLKNVRRTLDLLLLTLLIGGPLIVIAAGGGGYFLAARALTPIDTITRTARHISAEDLSARLNLPETDDEMGRLAATFDSMLSRLDDAFRRERQFTADASHELRTPLSAMQTIIASTLARRRALAEYEQALSDLSQEAEHMRTLTEELLHLARNDALRQPAKFERVDLSILLKDVVDSLRPLAEAKGLKLIDHVPEAGLTLMGDSDGLIRLFVNLLDNAIKYTEQGLITLSAKPCNGELLAVAISDTGVGIPPEHLPRVFNRFYRVDESRSKEGAGLGLSIALNVARAHGGQIDVESKVGKGTTFTVQLSTN